MQNFYFFKNNSGIGFDGSNCVEIPSKECLDREKRTKIHKIISKNFRFLNTKTLESKAIRIFWRNKRNRRSSRSLENGEKCCHS